MKKYITPKARFIEIDTEGIIADSPTIGRSSEEADPELEVLSGRLRTNLWDED
ncbi:MAG: hypothetical protein KBT20_07775 [Bacteroidales bacterium]|nr:hypothetical protein [Candidatus Liminaster caballi]